MPTVLTALRPSTTCSKSATTRRAASARAASTSASVSARRGVRVALGTSTIRTSSAVSGRGLVSRRGGSVPRARGDDPESSATTDTHARSQSRRSDDTTTASSSSSSDATSKDEAAAEEKEKVDYVQEFKNGVLFGETVRKRFTEARIDDKGLPIADALVVTTVPVFVATVILALGVPRPSWLVQAPWIPKWRSLPFLIPALSHGAKLSCAWLPGALAAKAYEREAYDGTVDEAVRRTIKGGCFAIGILILATQFQLNFEFASRGVAPPRLGDSPETDLILNGVASELIADCAFEALGLLAWRIVRCTTDIPPDEDRWG